MSSPLPPFPWPVVDHHAHLRPGKRGIAQVRAFERSGGTHIFLATQNYLPHAPVSLSEYEEQFNTTLAIARKVEELTEVKVFPVLAPYPIDLISVTEHMGLAASEQLQRDALLLAGRFVVERKAVAIGEAGRAHFPVPVEVGEALERVLETAMAVAHDVDCPVVLHTEDLDGKGYEGLNRLATRAGLRTERVVKHYARSCLPREERRGIVPSFIAKRDLLREALGDPGPWFMETDYLDDPARPGAVLSLETVPRRAAWISSSPELAHLHERLTIPFVESPKRVYGLDLRRE